VGAVAIRAMGIDVVHLRVPNPLSRWQIDQEER